MKSGNLSFVFTVLLFVLISSVTALQSENIVAGGYGKIKQFVYQVSLQVGSTHICGGSLIAPNLVLTAAHCVVNDETNEIEDKAYIVVAGTADNRIKSYRIPVTKIYSHKKYKNTEDYEMIYDIAVLKLKESFDISNSSRIGVISLPRKDEEYLGKTAVVSGFGWDRATVIIDPVTLEKKTDGTSTGKLKFGEVVIVKPKLCDADIYPHRLCGQMKQKSPSVHEGTCKGDSGGPLVLGNKVIGIVSAGPTGCDESTEPAIYTKVSDFLDFIKNAMNDKKTSDMKVKTITYVYYDIPALGIRKSTNSPKLQKLLAYIQENYPKSQELYKEVLQLQAIVQPLDIKKKAENLLYQAKYPEYDAKFEEYEILRKGIEDARNKLKLLL